VFSRLVVAVSAAYFKPMLRKPLAKLLCALHVEHAGHLVCICVPSGISIAAKALLDNVYLLRLQGHCTAIC
jgi:hypothetical protein